MKRKGQGAMEYLMTYGWALLVIVVVGAALYSLGVLNPSVYQQKGCRGFQYFVYQDHKLNTTHFEVQVKNGNQDITVSSIKVGDNTDETPLVSDADIQEGDTFIITSDTIPSVTSGSDYTYDVTIVYDVVDGISGNVDKATCTGTVA